MEIEKLLIENLDTRDKRFMFLKIFYPYAVPFISIEGSPKTTAFNIQIYFRNNGNEEDLLTNLKNVFQ